MTVEDRRALEVLDFRLRAILPGEYQDSYEEVQPVSMGSAGLKFGVDGLVAWDEMWGSFCDLAMAGGPPHKGMLLQPGTHAEVDEQRARHAEIVREICRGITLVTDLTAEESPRPGWVRIECLGEEMASWLVRAITMENVAARSEGEWLELPAAPGFRLEKEIKNVITVIAKTSHYWMGHIPRGQQRGIAMLFRAMAEESPLLTPVFPGDNRRQRREEAIASAMAATIQAEAGLAPSAHAYAGWLGVECAGVRTAVWLMRALVVVNVLARREDTVLFLPLNGDLDPTGGIAARALARLVGLEEKGRK
jgi:hypothetical protein